MLMLGLATLLFFPLLDGGTAFGQGLVGAVAPVALPVAVGAGIFGIGMQLAGACASGPLYTVGGGSTKMAFTLAFFLLGSLLGADHLTWWLAARKPGRVSLWDRGCQ